MAEKEILCAYGVDFDAVAGWLGSYGGENSPLDISRGLFAGEVGVPRLLDLFRDFGIRVTWFVPGHSVETFPEQSAAIVEAGHELGLHGYSHENPIAMSLEQEEDVLDHCIELLEGLTGERPAGYVAPWWEFSAVTAELLLARAIEYDHSLMHDDFHPYYARTGDTWTKIDYSKPAGYWMKPLVRGRETDLVEIPASWHLDDMVPLMFMKTVPNSQGFESPRGGRGDVARRFRLGVPQARIRDLPHDHSPRRVGAAAGARHARAAVRAHELEAGGAVRHHARDRRRLQTTAAPRVIGTASGPDRPMDTSWLALKARLHLD